MLNTREAWVLWFSTIKSIPKSCVESHLYLNLIGVTLETVEYDMILCHVTRHVTMSVMSNIDGSLTVSLAAYNMTWKHIHIAQAGGELKTKSNKLIVKRGKSHRKLNVQIRSVQESHVTGERVLGQPLRRLGAHLAPPRPPRPYPSLASPHTAPHWSPVPE